MWLKVAIAALILWWLSRKAEAAAPPPPAWVPPEPGDYKGAVDTGPSTITFHAGEGMWDAPWVKPAGTDTGCEVEPDEFGGMRYVCP